MPSPSKKTADTPQLRFSGFPKAGLQFLRDLKKNNDREWFRERKSTYEETVRAPMELLVNEVAAECRARGLTLFAKEKFPVMRVYRDIRFSADKRPFNTHVGSSLRRSQGKVNSGEIYLHVSPEESFIAAGWWMPERPFLHAWRTAMADKPEEFARVQKALAKHKLEFSRESALTRFPRGFDVQAESPIAEAFKLTSYIVTRPLQPAEYHSPNLVLIAADVALQAKPLLDFGWKLNYSPKQDMLAGE